MPFPSAKTVPNSAAAMTKPNITEGSAFLHIDNYKVILPSCRQVWLFFPKWGVSLSSGMRECCTPECGDVWQWVALHPVLLLGPQSLPLCVGQMGNSGVTSVLSHWLLAGCLIMSLKTSEQALADKLSSLRAGFFNGHADKLCWSD